MVVTRRNTREMNTNVSKTRSGRIVKSPFDFPFIIHHKSTRQKEIFTRRSSSPSINRLRYPNFGKEDDVKTTCNKKFAMIILLSFIKTSLKEGKINPIDVGVIDCKYNSINTVCDYINDILYNPSQQTPLIYDFCKKIWKRFRVLQVKDIVKKFYVINTDEKDVPISRKELCEREYGIKIECIIDDAHNIDSSYSFDVAYYDTCDNFIKSGKGKTREIKPENVKFYNILKDNIKISGFFIGNYVCRSGNNRGLTREKQFYNVKSCLDNLNLIDNLLYTFVYSSSVIGINNTIKLWKEIVIQPSNRVMIETRLVDKPKTGNKKDSRYNPLVFFVLQKK